MRLDSAYRKASAPQERGSGKKGGFRKRLHRKARTAPLSYVSLFYLRLLSGSQFIFLEICLFLMDMEWKPKDKAKIKAFKVFTLKSGEMIGVFQGSKGNKPDLDIVVKYRDKYTKTSVPRTPKHIHWVIDLLIKKEHNEKLTLEFIRYLLAMYDKIKPFSNKTEQQKCECRFTNPENLKKFEKLNNYGQYSVEFIGHVIELLSIEEKTSMEGAFMFKEVLEALSKNKDIFSIVSAATHNGRL